MHCPIRDELITADECSGIILNAHAETLATCQLCEHGPRPGDVPQEDLVPIDEKPAASDLTPPTYLAELAYTDHTQLGDELTGAPGTEPAATEPPPAPARDARVEKIAAARAHAPESPAEPPAREPATEPARMVSYGAAPPAGVTPVRLRLYAATGKTRKELAGAVGCSPENISAIMNRIERGGRPRGKAYARLLGMLGPQADWVFGSAAHDPEPVAAPAEPADAAAQAAPADLAGVKLEALIRELRGRLPGVAITLAM